MATAGGAIASTVFSAVNGCIGSTNTIIGWISKLETFLGRCGEAGETIRKIQESVEERREELQHWRDLWNINATTKYAYQRELWGDARLKVIQVKIAIIEDLCNKFKNEFEIFFKETKMSQLLQNAAERNISISTQRSQAAFHDDAKDKVKDASKVDIIRFVRNLEPQAVNWLSRLRTTLDELSEIADRAFFARHKEKASGGLTTEQLEKVKRSTFSRMAVELRQASEELFVVCFQAQERVSTKNCAPDMFKANSRLSMDLTGIKRGINLDDIQSQRGIQLLYHLVLEWEASPRELCIQGPLLDPNQARNIGSFIDAYKAVQNNEEATILIDPNEYFHSRGSFDSETLRIRDLDNSIPLAKSLADLVHVLDVPEPKDNMDVFPRSQRLTFAFKLVECGLLLAGTSWLSMLHTRFVRRSPTDRVDYCYTLDANKIIEKASWNNFKQVARQMFAIGRILLELGTGELAWDIRPCQVGNLRTEEFLLCRPGMDHKKYGRYRSLPDIKDILNTTMGNKYASATAYCLREIRQQCGEGVGCAQRAEDDIFKNILAEYFVNIYTPMEMLARESAWEIEHLEDILSMFGE